MFGKAAAMLWTAAVVFAPSAIGGSSSCGQQPACVAAVQRHREVFVGAASCPLNRKGNCARMCTCCAFCTLPLKPLCQISNTIAFHDAHVCTVLAVACLWGNTAAVICCTQTAVALEEQGRVKHRPRLHMCEDCEWTRW